MRFTNEKKGSARARGFRSKQYIITSYLIRIVIYNSLYETYDYLIEFWRRIRCDTSEKKYGIDTGRLVIYVQGLRLQHK